MPGNRRRDGPAVHRAGERIRREANADCIARQRGNRGDALAATVPHLVAGLGRTFRRRRARILPRLLKGGWIVHTHEIDRPIGEQFVGRTRGRDIQVKRIPTRFKGDRLAKGDRIGACGRKTGRQNESDDGASPATCHDLPFHILSRHLLAASASPTARRDTPVD